MWKNVIRFIFGFFILFGFYLISLFILKITHIIIPPAIFGLILFALSLHFGIIKEEWVKLTVNFLLKNMAILFVPFIGGLVVYETIIVKNLIPIILIILATTTLTIVITGLFVEYGIKYRRLSKIRGKND